MHLDSGLESSESSNYEHEEEKNLKNKFVSPLKQETYTPPKSSENDNPDEEGSSHSFHHLWVSHEKEAREVEET